MPNHTTTLRQLADDERARLRNAARMTADHWAWVLLPILCLVFIGYLLGALVSRCFAWPSAAWLITSIGFAAGIWPTWKIHAAFDRERTRAREDLENAVVEVIEVSDPIVVAQEEHNDEGPIFYLDIGGGKVLLVWGQWLYDPTIFPGSAWHHDDEDEDFEEEFPFPTSHFVLHRSASLGRVLRVDLTGPRVAPSQGIPVGAVPLGGQRESEIFDGALGNLPEAMERFMKAQALVRGLTTPA